MRDYISNELDLEERKRRVGQCLRDWVDKRRPALEMTSYEIGAIKGSARAIALGKAVMVNSIIVCQQHPRADTRLGLLAVIGLLCDRDEGSKMISIGRFASLLRRNPNNIRVAIKSLEDDGVIGVTRSGGEDVSKYWIKVPRFIVELEPHPSWIVDAISQPAVNGVQKGPPSQTRGGGRPPLQSRGAPSQTRG
jgi:hypothetical protein